jgi:hypothetical protein
VNDVTLILNCVILSRARRITFIPNLNHRMVLLSFKLMKNSLYVIAGLLLVIWGILFWGLHVVGAVHFLLVGALFIILVRLVFSKQLGVR